MQADGTATGDTALAEGDWVAARAAFEAACPRRRARGAPGSRARAVVAPGHRRSALPGRTGLRGFPVSRRPTGGRGGGDLALARVRRGPGQRAGERRLGGPSGGAAPRRRPLRRTGMARALPRRARGGPGGDRERGARRARPRSRDSTTPTWRRRRSRGSGTPRSRPATSSPARRSSTRRWRRPRAARSRASRRSAM